jgi:5-methyltetrahydropteroyltriglutamate--homocysteine methyltransferase
MARGAQGDAHEQSCAHGHHGGGHAHGAPAQEMTKWFDTNYHYLVPEFTKHQAFSLSSRKVFEEFREARALGVNAKPVLIGPVSYLLLGKEKEPGFHRLEFLDRLMPVYVQILDELQRLGAQYVQIDEPFLALDLSQETKHAYRSCYTAIAQACPGLNIILATYFGGLDDNLELATTLPIRFLHLDLVRAPKQLDHALAVMSSQIGLSLGVVDGRNVWKNELARSLTLVSKAVEQLGRERVALAPSCSLLHVPCDLALETNEKVLPAQIKRWLAFAQQKLDELVMLKHLAQPEMHKHLISRLLENTLDMESRRQSKLIHKGAVKRRLAAVSQEDLKRKNPFKIRQQKQHRKLNLPLFPTTTIGSFPQTDGVRKLRVRFKKGELTKQQYQTEIRAEIQRAIRWQEEVGLDVLVHGEFERNDMVEYFGERLGGFAITTNGWVQSYGSRCVKPPIIYGDVQRQAPMTVEWVEYAQSLTAKPVKGMLTGPITILQWSYVRDDQPRSTTAKQIALALRDEVCDLEKTGIGIIQIDEPALREGLPLRNADRAEYLRWAVEAFRLASCPVADETQIHTHMCYSEFNDIIESIAELDADVITIETSRSQMELLDAFASFRYPNEIGPGVYDIHSPRIPRAQEITTLLRKALTVLPARNVWVNPDCGLKTRNWPEIEAAIAQMVAAAIALRARVKANKAAL